MWVNRRHAFEFKRCPVLLQRQASIGGSAYVRYLGPLYR
jgi:hypothetical protein